MGRYYFYPKAVVEDLKSIEVWWLAKNNYFQGYKSGVISWKDNYSGISSFTASLDIAKLNSHLIGESGQRYTLGDA